MSDIWHDESWLMTVMTVMEVGGKIIIESLGFFGLGNPFLARIWDLDATCAAHIAELSFIWFCTCMWWQRTAIHHFNRHQENQSSASYQSHFKTFNCHVSLWLPDCARVPDSRVSVFVGRSIYGSIIMSIFILSYHILSSCITRFHWFYCFHCSVPCCFLQWKEWTLSSVAATAATAYNAILQVTGPVLAGATLEQALSGKTSWRLEGIEGISFRHKIDETTMKCFPFILLGLEILVLGERTPTQCHSIYYILLHTTHYTLVTLHTQYSIHCTLTLYTGCFAPLQSLYPTYHAACSSLQPAGSIFQPRHATLAVSYPGLALRSGESISISTPTAYLERVMKSNQINSSIHQSNLSRLEKNQADTDMNKD